MMETFQASDAVAETARVSDRRGQRWWSNDEIDRLHAVTEPGGTLGAGDVRALAQVLGRTQAAIRAQLHKLGLVRLRYEVNERFFDAWSRPMAWVLGMLLSDGHLAKGASTIVWCSTNRQLLESVRACLESTHRVYPRPRARSSWGAYYCLAISRDRLRAGLDMIVPISRQRERCHLPEVPAEMLSHFVRGYFEGNGSMYFRASGRLHVNITGNRGFLEDLRLRLLAADVAVPTRARNNAHHASAVLPLSDAKALTLAEYLYRDAPEGQRVEQRYEHYLRCLEQRPELDVPRAA